MSRVDDEVALAWRTGPGRARRWCREFARRWRRRPVGLRAAQHSHSLGWREAASCHRRRARGPPGLLVLDEPTANLDPPGMYAVFERLAILARRREHTIVLIEHRLEAALPLADEVLLLDDEGHQLAFAPAGAVGRRQSSCSSAAAPGCRGPGAARSQPRRGGRTGGRASGFRRPGDRGRALCWRPPTFASNTLPTRAGSAWPWMGSRCPCEPASEWLSLGRMAREVEPAVRHGGAATAGGRDRAAARVATGWRGGRAHARPFAAECA